MASSSAHQTPAQASPYRPSAPRAVTMGAANPYYKSRAASQPAGERAPAPASLGGSRPDSGRGSPGGMFGVIGGSRTPGRFASGYAAGTTTRANSFSGGEHREMRNSQLPNTLASHIEEHPDCSSSPFPTFSPSSSPSASPTSQHLPMPHSPPRAGANTSRSRSQSLAVGVRPSGVDRFGGKPNWPLSTIESKTAFSHTFDPGWSDPVDTSNQSPFTRSNAALNWESTSQTTGRFGSPLEGRLFNRAHSTSTWGSSAPPGQHSVVSPPPVRGFGVTGQPTYSTQVGGFGEPNYANGGRSGSNSRRHSVSVVGGPGGRRDLFLDGLGMTSPPNRRLGPSGFTDEELLPEQLGNALSLEIDQSRRRGVEIEVGKAQDNAHHDLYRFDRHRETKPFPIFEKAPNPSRSVDTERSASTEVGPGSHQSHQSHQSRFSFDQKANGGSPAKNRGDIGAVRSGFQASGPGPIGAPPSAESRGFQGHSLAGRQTSFTAPGQGPNASLPGGFGRPPSFNPYGGDARPQQSFNQTPQFAPPQGAGSGFPPPVQGQYQLYPSSSPPRQQPTSPSFSSLSLSDLGRGVPLTSLPPNTPLYIAAFKAGRRDVYYCADPTLLISNGDRVIVEADRGSDLGTIVYDQLTPLDVREWQERQATAALLSGAREHQPPGMAAAKPAVTTGEPAGADLATLLSGVGNGSSDNPMSSAHSRGPLAKEIMPKRIFAKSSQGPEEQARMLEKTRDEHDAMIICREKAAQRGLPMQIVDAEYQWDRRKLTFYFKADKRIDFRDLTKENFRIFKSRIWMAMVPKDDPRNGN